MSEEIEPLLFPPQDTCSGEELQWYEDFPSMPLFPPDDGYYTASLGQVGGAGAGTSSSSRGVDVRGGLPPPTAGHHDKQYLLHMALAQQQLLPSATPPPTPSVAATNHKRKFLPGAAPPPFIDIALGPSLGAQAQEQELPLPKSRLRWTPQLHDRFIAAVNLLGGENKATPKTIMHTMKVPGLTIFHVKSHLQKYRILRASSKLDQGLQNPARTNNNIDSDLGGQDPPQGGLTESQAEGKRKRENGDENCGKIGQMEKDLQSQLESQRNLSSIVSKLGSDRSSSEDNNNVRARALKILDLHRRKKLSSKASAVIDALAKHSGHSLVSLVEGCLELGRTLSKEREA